MDKEKSFDAILHDLRVFFQNAAEKEWSAVGKEKVGAMICEKLAASRDELYEEYTYLNHKIKRKFMRYPDGMLDRHKCAACFMAAFLEIVQLPNLNKPRHVTYKERIAIVAGLSIMATMIKEELSDMGAKKLRGEPIDLDKYTENWDTVAYRQKNNGDFAFPKSICDTNGYLYNWEREIHRARKDSSLFALSLANELFCIETYNRQLAKIDKLEKEIATLKRQHP